MSFFRPSYLSSSSGRELEDILAVNDLLIPAIGDDVLTTMIIRLFINGTSLVSRAATLTDAVQTARLVSRLWNTVMVHDLAIWSRLLIHDKTPSHQLSLWLDRGRNSPLSITILFRRYTAMEQELLTACPVLDYAARVSVFITRIFRILDIHLPRCYHLAVRSYDSTSSILVMKHLSDIPGDTIQSLDLRLQLGSAIIQRSNAQLNNALHFPIICHTGMPKLRRMALTPLPVMWTGHSFMEHLVELKIGNYSFQRGSTLCCEASSSEVVALFTSTPRLVKLSLIAFNLEEGQSVGTEPVVTLGFLTHLELDFQHSTSCRVLSRFNLPALHTLRLTTEASTIPEFIPYMSHILRDITTAELYVAFADGMDLLPLIRTMHRLRHLDLRHGQRYPVFAIPLFFMAKHTPSLCPSLRLLCLGEELRIEDLENLILYRAKGSFAEDMVVIHNHEHSNNAGDSSYVPYYTAVGETSPIRCSVLVGSYDIFEVYIFYDVTENVVEYLLRAMVSTFDYVLIGRRSSSAICGLLSIPPEVLEIAVVYSICDYFDDPAGFVRHRTNVLRTCRSLYFVVVNCAALWNSHILIHPNGNLRLELVEVSRHFRERTLSLHTYFSRHAEYENGEDYPDSATLLETLSFIQKHSWQCKTIYLHIDSFPEWHDVLAAFHSIRYDRLEDVTFVLYCDRLPTSQLAKIVPMDLPFTGEELQHITSFRIYDFRFRWNGIARFTGLTILVLHDQYGGVGIPTINQMEAVLRSNPRLCQLSIRLHLDRTPSASILQPIRLNHLVELDVDFNGPGSTRVVLMSKCRMPRLQVLSFAFNLRSEDFQTFMALASNAPLLSRVILSGRLPDDFQSCDLLAILPALTHFDISGINGIIFKNALAEYAEPDGIMCPMLHTLSVYEYSVEDVREVIDARILLGSPLRILNCHQIFPTSVGSYSSYLVYLADLEYVRNHVDALHLDPEEEEWSIDWSLR
ncbi:hypothetical protein B0H19DRAFT_1060127 [Mycena capillaripes]|nr:hypothetical protein B0H19DRAFT_1060127 [Mycena capillaripes]